MRKFLAILITFFLCVSLFAPTTSADEISDLQKQIDELAQKLDQSKSATTPLESEVKALEGQLASLNVRISDLTKQLAKNEQDLEFEKKVMARTVRNFYIGGFVDIPLLTIFASGDATQTLKLIAFQQASSREDKEVISNITEQIAKLADDKRRLAVAQGQINKQSQVLKGEIASAKAFQSELEGKISALTARQQEIISAKSGTFTTSVGDVPLADDPNAAPSYNPGFSPAFGGFSFGAYTHRNGMSQYGAKGRADEGKKAEEILAHYYSGSTLNKNYSVPANIEVEGFGRMSFEVTYM